MSFEKTMTTIMFRMPKLRKNCLSQVNSTLMGKILESRLHCSTVSIRRDENKNESTIDSAEVDKHSKLKDVWWDRNGPMKALHAMNVIRVPFIRDGLVSINERKNCVPLEKLKILDVGCGAGILSEALARLGANVTGLDASEELVNVAKQHCNIDSTIQTNKPSYICDSIENHVSKNKEAYDGVVASEVIEHVDNKELFIKSCLGTLKPGGRIFFTTPSRTRINQVAGIYMAEYVLKIVPQGTHEYEKMMTPTELTFLLERNNCVVEAVYGAFYHFLTNRWEWINSKAFLFAVQARKHS